MSIFSVKTYPLKQTSLAVLLSLNSLSLAQASTTLSPGDIAIVNYLADGTDTFSFVTLSNIDTGTQIHFTDNGWKSDSTFRTGEGVITWTADKTIKAGTVITITNTPSATIGGVTQVNQLNFSGSGDQLLVYQGSQTSPQFIYALNNEGSATWQTESDSSKTSTQPTGLKSATAPAFPEKDNYVYTGTTTGSKDELLTAISNANNWTGDNSPDNMPPAPASFSVGTGHSNTISIQPLDAQKAEGNSGSTTFTFTITRTDKASTASIDYTVNGAADANDFGGTLPSGTLSFESNVDSKTLALSVSGDTTIEADETFTVALSNPSNGMSIATASADGVIQNDDIDNSNITRISAIQGNGNESPLNNQENICIEGIITADMQNMNGFFIQEEIADQDSDPKTSEAIFVYDRSPEAPITAADVGKIATACGKVQEYKGLTELRYSNGFAITNNNRVQLEPIEIKLPIADANDFEAYENMLITIKSASTDGKLLVTDTHNFGRYGHVMLTSDELFTQFTENNTPDVAGYSDYIKRIKADHLVLDNADDRQNVDVIGRNGQPLSASNTLRAGDNTETVTGILDQLIDKKPRNYLNYYRIQPIENVIFDGAPRPTIAELQERSNGAEIKIASVNVLNYFSTFKDFFKTPYGSEHKVRGANNQEEFKRQTDKLVSALLALDADIYGLMELQNNGFADGSSAIDALVDALNTAQSNATFDYVSAPFTDGANTNIVAAGADAITVGFIYRTNSVDLAGSAAVPNTATYNAFSDLYGNRVPVAQTFKTLSDNQFFTVVVNHFKSKGSGDATRGLDIGDGQGNSYLSRELAATQITQWLATNPTNAPTDNKGTLLIGDFNAYSKETTINNLIAGGYRKVSDGVSFTWDGMWGSLDHAFADETMSPLVQSAVKWPINAAEPSAIDYDFSYKSSTQKDSYYAPDMFRSSDHDPIVLGLTFAPLPTPVINHVPENPQSMIVGKVAELADITIDETGDKIITVTLTATDGIVGNVMDADESKNGVQLIGKAPEVNAQLAKATFTPSTINASLSISARIESGPTVNKSYLVTITFKDGVLFSDSFE